MTASLPKAREEALASVLMKQGRPLNQIPTKEQFERWETDEPRETLPRYRKERVTDNDPLPIIRETLKNGGKVLWVCNTVGRVMDAADPRANFTRSSTIAGSSTNTELRGTRRSSTPLIRRRILGLPWRSARKSPRCPWTCRRTCW